MGIGAVLKCQKSNLWAIPVNQYNPPVLSQLGDSFSRKIDIFTLDFCFEWFASFKQGITAESDNQCWFSMISSLDTVTMQRATHATCAATSAA